MTPHVALVSGGTGFVGSRIVTALLKAGAEVRVLTSAHSDRSRLQAFADRIHWFSMDDADLARATRGVNCFFNMAVVYDRPTVSDDLLQRINVDLPLRLIKELRTHSQGVTCVLGDSFFRKFPPLATRQPRYTESKSRLAQCIASDQSMLAQGLRVALLQIEQVYGPGEAFSKAFPLLTRRMLENVPRLPTTHGQQRRDFVHVDDVASAALRVAEAQWQGLQRVECGSGVSTSVRAVLERLKALTRSTTVLGFGDLAPDQFIDESVADLSWLAQQGWTPRRPLEAGLAELVEDVTARIGSATP